LFPLFATGVVDTRGKFAAGVIATGGNLPLVSLTQVASLPPVSLTPLENLCQQHQLYWWQNGKFATGVVDTRGAP
jgi:hypothetical protein